VSPSRDLYSAVWTLMDGPIGISLLPAKRAACWLSALATKPHGLCHASLCLRSHRRQIIYTAWAKHTVGSKDSEKVRPRVLLYVLLILLRKK